MSKSAHYLRIEEFMRKAGQLPEDGPPSLPDSATRVLRAKLIFEECMEVVNALGVSVRFPTETGYFVLNTPENDEVAEHKFVDCGEEHADLTDVIDGVIDCSVVSRGTLIACRVPDQPFEKLIDEHNLAKFGPGGHRRKDGKWIKPAGLKPPDIRSVLSGLKQIRVDSST